MADYAALVRPTLAAHRRPQTMRENAPTCGLEVNCQLVLCPCLRWQIGRFLAFEDVSHRGVVAGQDFDDHRIDGYHSSS